MLPAKLNTKLTSYILEETAGGACDVRVFSGDKSKMYAVLLSRWSLVGVVAAAASVSQQPQPLSPADNESDRHSPDIQVKATHCKHGKVDGHGFCV